MTYPTDEWPTTPVVWQNEMPRCVGACQQGRIPCQHPLACSCTTLSDMEFDDAAAELTTDRAPLASTAGEDGELPFGRLVDEMGDPTHGNTVLLLLLLLVALAAWLAAMAHLLMMIGDAA